jgi:hypothetical protein
VPREQDRRPDRRCADGKKAQAEVLLRPALGDGGHEAQMSDDTEAMPLLHGLASAPQ